MNDTKQHDDGGPAFPTQNGCRSDEGMSLRDWFAGMALQGLLHQRRESGDYESVDSQVDKDDAGIVYKGSYITCRGDDDSHYAARDAYEFADAMLAVRKGVLP